MKRECKSLDDLVITNTQYKNPFVAVIIVNWNHAQDTVECLESLQQISYSNVKIVVVDNGSTDDSPEQIKAIMPEVELIRNERNLGFGGGVNVGIDRALTLGADYVLLLNNDTAVAPDFLEPLVSFCECNPKVGIVGGTVYYYDTEIPFSSGAWIHQYLPLLLRDFTPRPPEDLVPQALDYIWAQMMLIRRELLQVINGFDPKFFMYYEDCDFCRRASAAGFRVYYVPEARMWHKVGFSTQGHDWVRWRYKISSMMYFYRKHGRFGLFQAMLQTLLTLAGIVVREIKQGNWRWISYPFSK